MPDQPGDALAVTYQPPKLTVIGTVQELTQSCDKSFGSSDGFTFDGQAVVCAASA